MPTTRCCFPPVCAAVMTMFAAALLPGNEGTTQQLSSQVDRLFSKWNRPDSPGMAVGIVQGGELVHGKGYGMANLDHAIPIDTTTVFEVASVTKSFTTACFALLLDNSDVKLDDDVRKYVPELPATDPPIRVRHLVRCESGLRDFYLSVQLAGWSVLDTWTVEDVLQLIAAQRQFDFQPGEQFAYSNSDFFLMALIVERVTGESLAGFAQTRIFRPLGMNHTFYATDPSIIVSTSATGYERKWRTGKYHKFELRSDSIGPYGLKTTIEDLARWDQNFYDNRLIAGPHFEEFLRTGCLIGNRRCLESFPDTSYRGANRNWYTGGMPGFMAQFVRFPEHNLSIALLCNISDGAEWREMAENGKQIADLYLADRLEPKPVDAPRPKPAFVRPPVEELRPLVGPYRRTSGQEEGFTARVIIKSGQLIFADHFGRETRLAAVNSRRFLPSDSWADHEFSFSITDGKRPALTIKTAGNSKKHYEPITVAKPARQRLAAYAGSFYCPELLTTYFIGVNNDRLFLRINNRRPEELAPTILDEFVPSRRPTTDEGRVLRFSEYEGGKPMRLRVRLWRGHATFERVGR